MTTLEIAGVGVTAATVGVVATTFTSNDVVTIIVALGGLATIVGGVIVSIISARVKAAVTTAADVTAERLDTIGRSVDGTATRAQERNDAVTAELKSFMREIIAEKTKSADTLAVAAAATLASTTKQPAVAAPLPLPITEGVPDSPSAQAVKDSTTRTDENIKKIF